MVTVAKPRKKPGRRASPPPASNPWPGDDPWEKAIHDLRTRLGLSQTEAGERIGISQRLWSGFELGTHIPNAAHQILLKLLNAGKI